MTNERDRAGAGEGPDAGADGKPHDESEQGNPPKLSDDEGTGGEDEASTEKNGDDSHLHEDQKSTPLKT